MLYLEHSHLRITLPVRNVVAWTVRAHLQHFGVAHEGLQPGQRHEAVLRARHVAAHQPRRQLRDGAGAGLERLLARTLAKVVQQGEHHLNAASCIVMDRLARQNGQRSPQRGKQSTVLANMPASTPLVCTSPKSTFTFFSRKGMPTRACTTPFRRTVQCYADMSPDAMDPDAG